MLFREGYGAPSLLAMWVRTRNRSGPWRRARRLQLQRLWLREHKGEQMDKQPLSSLECVEEEFCEVPRLRVLHVFARMPSREAGPRLWRGVIMPRAEASLYCTLPPLCI